jgi:DNA-directed RNA polymerase specialized sigma24 family protein
MDNQVTPSELELARKVAFRIGRRWKLIDQDDLTSHLYLWMFEHTKELKRWRIGDLGNGALYVTLRREAAKFCAAETAASAGRPIQTPRFYTIEVVRRALPYIFEDSPVTLVVENPITGWVQWEPSENSVAMSILADVKAEFNGLAGPLQTLLTWRYRDGLSYEEISELRGITTEATRKAVERSLKRLSEALG